MACKTKPKNDSIMAAILVTRYKMGLIKNDDLKRMALDLSKPEKASAAKRLLEDLEDVW